MVASTPALFRYFTFMCPLPTASSPISKDNKGASYQDVLRQKLLSLIVKLLTFAVRSIKLSQEELKNKNFANVHMNLHLLRLQPHV